MYDYTKKIIVGSRASPLARAQVEIFLNSLKKSFGSNILNKFEKKFFTTSGDRFLAGRGVCTIICVGTNTFAVTGGGLT